MILTLYSSDDITMQSVRAIFRPSITQDNNQRLTSLSQYSTLLLHLSPLLARMSRAHPLVTNTYPREQGIHLIFPFGIPGGT